MSRVGATAAVLVAMALVVLDAGMTNVALPTIAHEFGVAPGTSITVVSAYQLALVAGLLPAAHVAERFGYRTVFVAGLLIFTAASALCAIASSLPLLVAARALQGLGGAAILALGIALLRLALGSERLGSAIAWNALNVALCAAAGPTLGGVILAVADWPWLFLVNLPIGLAAAWASRWLVEGPATKAAVDPRSILLYAGGVVLLLVAGESVSRNIPLAAAMLGVAVISLASLVRHELAKARPLVPWDLLALRPFRLAVVASIFLFVGHSAGLLGLAFHLQLGLSQSPLAAGLVLAAWPLAVALTSPWVEPLYRRHGTTAVCVAGAAILAAGLIAAALAPAHAGAGFLVIAASICGIGFGLFQVPNNRNLFMTAPIERSGAAGGMQGTARLCGQAVGAVMVSAIFSSANTAAPKVALAFAAASALIAALVSAMRGTTAGHMPIAEGA
jgi:DHA2 family multidrug resistance protein-like MFS transporter